MNSESPSDIFTFCQAVIQYLDQRLLDITTEPGSFLSIDDYNAWTYNHRVDDIGHSLAHLWGYVQVVDCFAASWEDACLQFGVSLVDNGWTDIRLRLLESWGVK